MLNIKLIATGLVCLLASFGAQAQAADALRLQPAHMHKITTVDERFQSYNIEAVEVTGGRFWKPYAAADATPKPADATLGGKGVGLSDDLFQYRPPIDLGNKRLRMLARGLSPAYVRVSGTWRNSTYFQDDEQPPLKMPPTGFANVLTRAEWSGVLDFAKATDSGLITSFTTSAGTRGMDGVWNSKQATRLLDYTRAQGGSIAAAEFMNEPTLAARGGGVPTGYGPASFAQDSEAFHSWLRSASPQTLFVGPGGEGEGMGWAQPPSMQRIPSAALMKAVGPIYDVYSYHFYSAISSRCSALLGGGATPVTVLTADWFEIPNRVHSFYSAIEKEYMPGKPIWVTETGEAACGGDRWASTFLDTFRYLNELGSLAKNGVRVVAHNTLAASDYALLDSETFTPRPDYWAALLWHRLMGKTVLEPGIASPQDVRVFAHCLPGTSGGVTVLMINPGNQSKAVSLKGAATSYMLTADSLESKNVLLNGQRLQLTSADQLPVISSLKKLRETTLEPRSITFLSFVKAGNAACHL